MAPLTNGEQSMSNPDTSDTQGTSLAGESKGSAPIAKTLKADASTLADEAKNVLSQVNQEATTQISQLAEQAKEKVTEAGDKVKGLAADQKDLFAKQIGGVAEALDRVAGDLETNNTEGAHYARIIADNAGQLASTIRDNDVDQIMSTAQDFGRRQPAAFLGAAALLGFAASRFMLASANRNARPQSAGDVETSNNRLGAPNYQSGRN
jgi:hypothetical protein